MVRVLEALGPYDPELVNVQTSEGPNIDIDSIQLREFMKLAPEERIRFYADLIQGRPECFGTVTRAPLDGYPFAHVQNVEPVSLKGFEAVAKIIEDALPEGYQVGIDQYIGKIEPENTDVPFIHLNGAEGQV